DHWAARHGIALSTKKPWAVLGEGQLEASGRPARVIVAKPRTYMNESGNAAFELVKRYHVDAARFVAVYDEMDLPLGKIRLRERGSAGGHNGIESIIQRLGTQDFLRLRVGIGRPPPGVDPVDYVLGDFAPPEREALLPAIERAADALDLLITQGAEAAMNEYNR
ncbi:MAG: aminoacyl-tRNA hydrolase, partial [Chloroflexi bacterium]|nr:aminoacyl-tRNA hydrolase [Chloroflexota bacterium]